MPLPSFNITGKSVDFTATQDGVQINLAVAPTDTDPAFMLGIPMTPDEAAQIGGLLIALAGACKAQAQSRLVAARGLHVVGSNGTG